MRDLEAVRGSLGGILQSITSLRALAGVGGVGLLLGLPLEVANRYTTLQRALTGITGSLEQGTQLAQQLNQIAVAAPFDIAATRGAAATLARVSGGQFAARAPAELAAATTAGTALGLGPQGVDQITGIMAAAQSMQTRRRMTAPMVNQLEDLGVTDVYGAIAAARNQAHRGEQWTRQSLEAYMASGGTLPGVETSQELTRILQQRYQQQAADAAGDPDVQAARARNQGSELARNWGIQLQRSLAPTLGAAAQGDVGGAIAGLAPWTLAQGNIPATLGVGALELFGGSAALDIILRGGWRAMRPVTRAGRAIGALPRGRTTAGVVPRVVAGPAASGVPATAARQYTQTVSQLVRKGAPLADAQAVARASVASAYGEEAAAAVEASGVSMQATRAAVAARTAGLYQRAATLAPAARQTVVSAELERQFGPETLAALRAPAAETAAAARGPGVIERVASRIRGGGGPGRPPVPPAGAGGVGAEAGAVEAAARDVGLVGRTAGALGRVGGVVGRAAPWLGLGVGLLSAYEATQQGQNLEAARAAGGAAGGFGGGWAGAAAGAALGTAIFPGVGTVVGGIAGGLGGGLLGGWAGEQVGGAAASSMDWQDATTANEDALQQQRQGLDSSRQLDQETVRLTAAFTELDQVVRSLTSDYQRTRALGGGGGGGSGGGSGGFTSGGAAPSLNLGPPGMGANGPIQPGNDAAPPKPGDVAGWRQWLAPFVPPELAANAGFMNTVLAGASAESGLDPNKDQQGGGGRGLFQFDTGGMGKGLTPAQLHDPAFQAQRIIPLYAQAWKNAPAGLSDADKASWVAAQAERPYDYTNPNSTARVNYASAYQKVAATTAPDVPTADVTSPATAPVSPDISSGDAGGNTIVQTGDINIPTTVGGVPQDRAGQRQWARDVSGVLMEEIAGGVSTSSSGTAVATSGAPLAFGG